MKNVLKILVLVMMSIFMINCSNDADNADAGNLPSNGWRIGSTAYTTAFGLRNAGQPNSITVFDAFPGGNNLNSVYVLFNRTTGIAAGTFKVVTKPNVSDLLADEIMIGAGTNYSNASGQYEKDYTAVIGQSVNATVTVNNGKAKIVIPQINIVSIPINTSSTTTTFSGTIVEQ